MKNAIKICSLLFMIFTVAILVNTIDVRSIWSEHPFATFCTLILSTIVHLVFSEEG